MGFSLSDDRANTNNFPRVWGSIARTVMALFLLINFSCADSDDLEFLKIKTFPKRQKDFSIWQLAQFDFEVQMCYIIKTDDDKIIVVDGGMPTSKKRVVNYLNQLGGKVDSWIITHPHLDHIGVLQEVLFGKEIQIGRIFHSKLDNDWVLEYEKKSGSLVSNYNKILIESDINVINVKKDDFYPLGDGVGLEILSVRNDSITVNAVNNSSLVFKIKSNTKSVLFLGDLGLEGGKALLKSIDNSQLKAEYVQMAHHGQGGVDLDFYKTVDANYALWPTPKWLWENKAPDEGPGTGNYQTPEVRKWVENELGIKKNYVAGLEGNIQID